jgi:CRISPR-associated exonuclease Cas4
MYHSLQQAKASTVAIEPADPIMLSALEHFSYCPRQYALSHFERAFDDNVHTKRGNAVYERVASLGLRVKVGI